MPRSAGTAAVQAGLPGNGRITAASDSQVSGPAITVPPGRS
jgi:hypothetical protein